MEWIVFHLTGRTISFRMFATMCRHPFCVCAVLLTGGYKQGKLDIFVFNVNVNY